MSAGVSSDTGLVHSAAHRYLPGRGGSVVGALVHYTVYDTWGSGGHDPSPPDNARCGSGDHYLGADDTGPKTKLDRTRGFWRHGWL